jgi:hypothetical protein
MQDHKEKMNHPKYHIAVEKQKIIEEKEEVKESPSLADKSSKFKNAGRDIVHKSPHTNIGKGENLAGTVQDRGLHEIVEEEIDPTNRESIQDGLPRLRCRIGLTRRWNWT